MTARTFLNLALPALAIGLLSACGSGTAEVQPAKARHNSFSMRVLPESFALGGSGRFELSVQEGPDTALLRIRASDVRELSHFYAELEYDNAIWTPLEADSAGLLGNESIQLLAGDGNGRVQYGELIPGADPAGVNVSGLLATIEFSREADSPRSASGAPEPAPPLNRDGSRDILTWYYENTGDYDQNGEVNIADLTPLGVNFGNSGPFAEDSAQWMVDGDHNGEINLADITPIGINFGERVDGYVIYAGPEGSGYPADPADDNGAAARSVATLDLSAALGGGSARKHFSYTDNTVQLHDRYWLRSMSAETASPASPLSPAWQQDWQRTVVFNSSEMPSRRAPALAVVAGKPCILYGGSVAEDGIALFTAAGDELGASWSIPQNVSGTDTDTRYFHMIEYNGRPAIVYYNHMTGETVFRKASAADGSSWEDPIPVIGASHIPRELFLMDGRPTIVSSDGVLSLAHILSADDSFFPGYALVGCKDLSAVVRSGGMEICYRSGTESFHANMHFDGFNFTASSTTLLSSDANLNYCPLSFDYAGQLYLLLEDGSLPKHELVHGVGGDAGVFSSPENFTQGVAGVMQCQSLDRIWMVDFNPFAKVLSCRYSAAGSLSEMTNLPPVAVYPGETFAPAIAEIRRHPAVVYVDQTDSGFDMIFARYI